jgi:hypothetical protein
MMPRRPKEVSSRMTQSTTREMTRSFPLISAALFTGIALQAQSILDTIRTPEKAVATVNQTLEGTWMMEIHVPGAPANQPPVQNLVTFHPDGTVVASAADGGQGTAHGVWVRVGDRKFLQTMFVFNFDATRAFTTILKVRVNAQVSLDGQTLKGTTEVAVMAPAGAVLTTIPGGTYSAVRLSPEIPGDFYDFQKVQ